MSIYNREQQYISLLSQGQHTVSQLSEKLFVSQPTVRRDIVKLEQKGLLECKRGVVKLVTNAADKRIPLFIRDTEQTEAKTSIAVKAAAHIKDGFVIMMDASTTAYHLIPHLARFKDILLITNGAKTALDAASMGIRTICTGGEMTLESFSYIGTDAEALLSKYNADIAIFSCRGISDDGIVSDNSILENSMRRIMMKNSQKSILLSDSSKFGSIYLNTLCHKDELDELISE